MVVLLTNDDGYDSEGIKTMEDALVKAGHEVWVVAPDGQRSGKSHAITIGVPLKLTRISERHYSFEGTPADCVLFSEKGAVDIPKPFVVISGINRGYNLSTDIIYSGTCSAASEGARCGYKSIAVSCYKDENGKYVFDDAAKFVIDNMDMLLSAACADNFVNVNVPAHSDGKWLPADIGHIEYYDNIVDKTEDGYFTLDGIAAPELVPQDKYFYTSDFYIAHNLKKISISIIGIMPVINKELQLDLSHRFC